MVTAMSMEMATAMTVAIATALPTGMATVMALGMETVVVRVICTEHTHRNMYGGGVVVVSR
jgi:hypothetical protein